MFSCEFCKISKNIFFTEHFRATTSIKVTVSKCHLQRKSTKSQQDILVYRGFRLSKSNLKWILSRIGRLHRIFKNTYFQNFGKLPLNVCCKLCLLKYPGLKFGFFQTDFSPDFSWKFSQMILAAAFRDVSINSYLKNTDIS